MERHRPWWLAPVIDLVIHVLIGTLLFAVIFAPAVLLEFGIEAIKGRISETLMGILKVTKIAIAVIDAVLYVIFMIRMGIEFVTELFHPRPGDVTKGDNHGGRTGDAGS